MSGTFDLVTGAAAGTSAGANDVDGGVTTIQSPVVAPPAGGTLELPFAWYLAHLSNSSSADYLRVSVVSGTTVTTVFQQLGAASNRAAAWQQASVPLSAYAGGSRSGSGWRWRTRPWPAWWRVPSTTCASPVPEPTAGPCAKPSSRRRHLARTGNDGRLGGP